MVFVRFFIGQFYFNSCKKLPLSTTRQKIKKQFAKLCQPGFVTPLDDVIRASIL